MMMPTIHPKTPWLVGLASLVLACGEAEPDASPAAGGRSGNGSGSSGAGGQIVSGGRAGTAGSGASGGTSASGAAGSSGNTGTAGAGTAGTAGSAAGAASGMGGAAGAAGAAMATGGSAGGGGGGTCTLGSWPATDPAVAGPFATIVEENVGPAVGEGEDGGDPVAFTLFRPEDLSESGRCHPVITWGNGTGSSPSLYGVFLKHLASHGFVVIASDSPNVARGEPPPMVAGVSWVIAQNEDPTSPLYGRIDTLHVGATGHSQGGFATTTAAGDSQITTMAPLCGAGRQRNLHGPAFLFCGGEDTVVTCDGIRDSFEGISGQPAMFANYLTADHADWVTFRGSTLSPVEVAVTAWMRVQLMGDTALRSWFYGQDCKLCTDAAWDVAQQGMDP